MAEPRQMGTGGLVIEALDHVSSLFRREVALARTEVSENLNKAVSGLIALAVALIFAVVALNTLSAAIVGWIVSGSGLGVGWASLIVTAVFAVIALILLFWGRSALRARNLAPTRTASSLRRDAESLKETYK